MTKREFASYVRSIAHKEPSETEWKGMWKSYSYYSGVDVKKLVGEWWLLKGQERDYPKKRRATPDGFKKLKEEFGIC